MFVVVLVMVIVTALISWSWVNGIDYMKENHPDYTGDDFLDCGEDDCVTKMAGRDGWDDNTVHSEGDF
jgi:hypothetical protein